MAYRVAGGRFGVRPGQPDRTTYELFAQGPEFDVVSRIIARFLSHYPLQFHRFPHWANTHSINQELFADLELELTHVFNDLYYLGPLRTYPSRIYAWSGARPTGVGPAGESAVDAILSSRERGKHMMSDSRPLTIDEYLAESLKRLGLASDFKIEALTEGRRIFEVKVRKSPDSPEVLLTEIGLGVSQIMPVLALCFYASVMPTLILEQPDMHLHPSAQAALADVFIDVWKSGGVQILFESHSEHLLRRLQRRIAEEKVPQDDVALYFCSSNPDGSSSLSRLEVDQFGNISNWPKDFFGDQFGEIAAMSEAALKRQGRSE